MVAGALLALALSAAPPGGTAGCAKECHQLNHMTGNLTDRQSKMYQAGIDGFEACLAKHKGSKQGPDGPCAKEGEAACARLCASLAQH